MRDLIWTIIGIWVIWRIIEAFRSFSSSKRTQTTYTRQHNQQQDNTYNTTQDPPQKKGELKPDAGEYIDYEEIK
jgi:hypothetical protein